LRCPLPLTLLVLALGAVATYAVWSFPVPFDGEAVRQPKVICVRITLLVVIAYFLTCFILMFVGAEMAREVQET
jgi:hypothetical protein